MHKEFIPYEEALAMKELGYKGDIIGMYDEDKDLFTLHDQDDIEDEWLPAPLYQQAFRWFREKYGLYGTSFPIPFEDDRFFEYNISNTHKSVKQDGVFNSYEEAQDACLKKLIEIVKQKEA